LSIGPEEMQGHDDHDVGHFVVGGDDDEDDMEEEDETVCIIFYNIKD
jgi:hypothetical protein